MKLCRVRETKNWQGQKAVIGYFVYPAGTYFTVVTKIAATAEGPFSGWYEGLGRFPSEESAERSAERTCLIESSRERSWGRSFSLSCPNCHIFLSSDSVPGLKRKVVRHKEVSCNW